MTKLATVQRWAIAGAIPLTALVFLRGAANPFQTVKSVIVQLVALLLIAGAIGSFRPGRAAALARVPFVQVWPALILVAAAATVASSTPAIAFFGDHPHAAGLLLYAGAAVIAVTVFDRSTEVFLRELGWVLTGTVVVVAIYALVQGAGLDPFQWAFEFSGAPSTLGQPNFASGYLGAGVPIALAFAIDPSHRAAHRAAGGVAYVCGVAATLMTRSAQGPASLLVGSALVLAAAAYARRETSRGDGTGRLPVAATVAAGLGCVGLVVAALVVSPLAAGVAAGFTGRVDIWRSAISVIRENPVIGTGLDTFGIHFFAHRPAAHGALLGSTNAEAAHSVPLAMFAAGGIPLGVAYLALVAIVAVGLVRGLVRVRGPRRRLLAAWGAVWLGYQVQSLVSIDVAALVVLHAVAAGAVMSLAREPRPESKKRPRKQRVYRPPGWQVAAAAALLVVGTWGVTRPLRADLAATEGVLAGQAGDVATATAALERAVELAPYRSFYYYLQASFLTAAGQHEPALRVARASAERDPGNSQPALLAGQLAFALGDTDEAERWYDEAVRRDPHNIDIVASAAQFAEEHRAPPVAAALRGRYEDLLALRGP